MLTNICAPFLQCDIRYDSFGASLVRSLIPNIRNSLLNNDTNAFNSLPKLVKLSIDNLKEEGLNLVTDEILPELTELYLQDDSFIDLFCETISSVPARYRDDVLVDSISRNSMSNDYRLRILAASSISLVRRYNRVISHFRALAADIHPSVRITIIKSLSNCNFDEPIINSIVNDAIHDVNCEVKNSIAEVIGYIAPHLTDQYIQLLENPETQNNALLCFNVMVTSSGFSTFFDIVIKIIEKNPDKVFSAIFHAAPFIDPCEHRLLYMCAKKLRHNESFIRNLFHFTRYIMFESLPPPINIQK
ncbi:hypothetical protein TRFO_42792 [Tritrichomonas foetus]|uniref:HEAT repeat family protein n=1 Tax=Tritrichomonas foetus TaxID=1144522 RepID=A0A1J4KUP1_9EUKA|nr:hypothetical protein TRFO_42792 [Tritrichomonas foetus]|eukprot:OHT14987.1 hypothetical protein TRFO_42792 [Tritrichomonas foetus]